MSLSKIAGAAVLLALTPVAMAGSAYVVNNCGYPVYYASVGQSQHADMQLLQGSFSAAYGEENNGISIKLAPSTSGPVTQFEITPSGDSIFYDMSNIDGNPFAKDGMILEPSMASDSSNPTCVAVDCPAGAEVCTAAYNQPDDVRTNVCSAESDLTLTLCPSGSSGNTTTASSDSEGSTSSASASSSSAPVASESATAPVSGEPATETATSTSWGKLAAKRAEHVHLRAHSRAFRV